jgi:BirA family biotin operon repressor/biotin-[acetyl-CoA-carboxylase] ligase
MTTPHHLHWGAEALWLELQPLLPGLSVEVVARIGSTNSELLERARRSNTLRGAPRTAAGAEAAHHPGRRQADTQPCLLVAEQQTQGRGRQGKAWQSAAGASLTFSLALPLAPADWSGLSLAVGLALAEALDPLQPGQAPRLGIKWPNDLLLIDPHAPNAGDGTIGRKLGGILIETVQVGTRRMAVIGIGLNLLPLPPEDEGEGQALNWGYACLQELHYGLTAPAALARVAAPLVRALLAFERDGFAPLQPRFAQRDLLAGHEVSTTLAGLPQGRADGVDAQGVLWLRVGEQRLPVASGEVSLRPLQQQPAAGGGAPAAC